MSFTPSRSASATELKRTATVLARRADDAHVRGAKVRISSGTIVVTARGDVRDRVARLGGSAVLTFRPVLATATAGAGSGDAGSAGATGGDTGVPRQLRQNVAELDCGRGRGRPSGPAPAPPAPASEATVMCAQDAQAKYVVGPAVLTGTQVKSASSELSTTGEWQVNLTLTPEGGDRFAETSSRLSTQSPPLNQVAIALDDFVLSAPAVTGPIPGGELQISGNLTRDDVSELAAMIDSGSLPLRLDLGEATFRR